MNTIQLEALSKMYDEGIIDGLCCPTCNAEDMLECPDCSEEKKLCRFCEGEGELDYTPPWSKEEILSGCISCSETGYETCELCSGTEEITCPTCEGTMYFEIMWNTLFEVPSYSLNLDWQSPSKDFAEKRKIAWSEGWLLLEDPMGNYWLAAGGCGYDFTWPRAKALIRMCGILPWEYVQELTLGGDVFVSDEWKVMIAMEAAERKKAMATSLAQDAAQFEEFASKIKKENKDE